VTVAAIIAALAIVVTTRPAPGDSIVLILTAVMVGATMAFMVIYWLLRAIQLRWYVEGIQFGEVGVSSDLRKRQVVGCYVRAFLACILYGIAAVAVIVGLLAQFSEPLSTLKAGESWSQATIGAFALLALAYLAFVIGMGLLKRYFVDRGAWRAATASAIVVNLAALDTVVAKGEAAGSLGEGLADALDFGGF
jgi:uncharacterized membrane protein YjgN (DUF898 family)